MGIGVLLWWGLQGHAAVTVDGDSASYATLEDALDAAPDGGTVRMDAGTYVLQPYLLHGDVTILGEGAVATGGDEDFPLFSTGGHALVIEGLTFEDLGGRVALVSSGSSLVLREVVVRDVNRFSEATLALVEPLGLLTIEDSTVVNFSATDSVFAPIIHNFAGTVLLSNFAVEDSSGVFASAIVSEGGTLEVEGGRFASMAMRAIELRSGASAEVRDTTFDALWSTEGGAIRVASSSLVMVGATVAGSASLAGDGGAVYAEGAVLDIQESVFESNASILDGGALFARESAVTLEGNDWFDNRAEQGGGAVMLESSLIFTSVANRYCANADEGVAGAVAVEGGEVERWVNDRYVRNRSPGAGAIHVELDAPTLLAHLTAAANEGGFADFLSAGATSTVDVRSSVFVDHEGFLVEPKDEASVAFDRVVYWPNDGVGSVSTGAFVSRMDPLLPPVEGLDCGDTLVWPALESPLIDPAFNAAERPDHDGSVADVGYLGGPYAPLWPWEDGDGDDSPRWMDCAPDDAGRSPNAEERCTGIDEDCDGWIDEDDPSLVPDMWAYPDQDGDGYGASGVEPEPVCEIREGLSDQGGDCADEDESIHPAAEEWCDGVDQNCDGDPQEGALDAAPFHPDQDGDGYGSDDVMVWACERPEGHLSEGSDCDDSDPSIHPGALEYCDAIDRDCDGRTDDEDAVDAALFFADSDQDGYGDPTREMWSCQPPGGFVDDPGDCDDQARAVNPSAREVAHDGVDQDCDGEDVRILAVGACSQGFSLGMAPSWLWIGLVTVWIRRRPWTPCG